MPVLEDGGLAIRPSLAKWEEGNHFRILDNAPDGEKWPFKYGDIVKCKKHFMHRRGVYLMRVVYWDDLYTTQSFPFLDIDEKNLSGIRSFLCSADLTIAEDENEISGYVKRPEILWRINRPIHSAEHVGKFASGMANNSKEYFYDPRNQYRIIWLLKSQMKLLQHKGSYDIYRDARSSRKWAFIYERPMNFPNYYNKLTAM